MSDEKIGSFTKIWLRKEGTTEAKPLLVSDQVHDKKNWRGFNSDIKWVVLPRTEYHKTVAPKKAEKESS